MLLELDGFDRGVTACDFIVHVHVVSFSGLLEISSCVCCSCLMDILLSLCRDISMISVLLKCVGI